MKAWKLVINQELDDPDYEFFEFGFEIYMRNLIALIIFFDRIIALLILFNLNIFLMT